MLGLIFLKYVSDAFEERQEELLALFQQDEAGNEVKLRSVSWLIDNALEEIEKSNAKLKGILNRISQYQLDNDKLIGLINTFSDTSFTRPVFEGERLQLQSKDVLGHVYEYFLGQFALAEGKQGGQYYTPKSKTTMPKNSVSIFRYTAKSPTPPHGS